MRNRVFGWVAAALVLAGCGGSGSERAPTPAAEEGSAGKVRAPEGTVAEARPSEDATAKADDGSLAPVVGTQTLREAIMAGRDLALLDVRTPGEFESGRIEGALNVPIYELDKRLDEVREFQAGRELVVYCEVGGRTRYAADKLKAAGFQRVVQYIPGMREWRRR